ncbi:thiamine pyrophosphate-dependent enzyme [Parvularcula maris]|uniref:2-oxoisovalerate dehydrogenase subunit alpha n=1 Tax=Parvularcula maris TaxID=2965077 RepID=A0A9X2RIV7_9PROT|nr:thiamine pyrophosphate-dependent enzyme [Parvularcula maris]MCQ8184008.1 3-methyl-2-oxobutanoate dehydrogenase (2-methylpropanoyl-transferring) subunit alpha [Parvularcula maris]
MDGFQRSGEAESGARRGLRVPQPPARPGEAPDFSNVALGEPGKLGLPPLDAEASAFGVFHHDLFRVLGEDGAAKGPHAGDVSDQELKSALLAMIRTRAFDTRMLRAQRQGKTSFYMTCTGEEAIGVGCALAAQDGDMHFPTYRQQGILFANSIDPEAMMNQIYSNKKDPLEGKQLPVLYSFREQGFFTISGNLGTQWPQAVGWGMASAIKGDDKIAIAYIGDGATAEGDWHQGNLFAAVYKAPVLLCVINNQWAISTTNAFAGADLNTFAARMGSYGLPALRVDGNDLLAVMAACRYAAARARAGHGAVAIEFLTYRGGAHSTSDDPTKYRAKEELEAWPLGDPIDRLKAHVIAKGILSADEIEAIEKDAETEMREAENRAEENGLVHAGQGAPGEAMFDDVYAELPGRLIEQKKEAGF